MSRIQESDSLTVLTVIGRLGVIDTWLLPLRQLRKKHKAGWDKEGLSGEDQKLRLVEENVRQGVQTVREHHDVVSCSLSLSLLLTFFNPTLPLYSSSEPSPFFAIYPNPNN